MDPASLKKNNYYLFNSPSGTIRVMYVMHTLNYRVFRSADKYIIHLADSSVKTNINKIQEDETEMG